MFVVCLVRVVLALKLIGVAVCLERISKEGPHKLFLFDMCTVQVAGALNMIGGDCLYGRNWGCSKQYDSLHFELCYYQVRYLFGLACLGPSPASSPPAQHVKAVRLASDIFSA